jgi:hypothetical protein
VVAFAGDAIICVFPAMAADEVFTNEYQMVQFYNCLPALKCAMTLVQFRTEQLSTHIGISCGRMTFGQLGGFNDHWNTLLLGKCIYDLSKCIDDAKSQEVVITEKVYKSILGELKSGETIDTHILPSFNRFVKRLSCSAQADFDGNRISKLSADVNVELARRFVPLPVLDSLTKNSFKTMSELREVTTMFISLDSYSYDVPDQFTVLHEYFFFIQKALEETGGFMRQFSVD